MNTFMFHTKSQLFRKNGSHISSKEKDSKKSKYHPSRDRTCGIDKKNNQEKKEKEQTSHYISLILGIVCLIFMFYIIITHDTIIMLFALFFSIMVGAYLLSIGLETRNLRKTIIGLIVFGTTIVAAGLIISIVITMVVSSFVLPANEIIITALSSAIQTIIAFVCFMMGW